VHRRNRNMGCIARRLGRQCEFLQESVRQDLDLLVYIEKRKIPNGFQPLTRSLRITGGCLIKHKLRNENVKLLSTLIPPCFCDLLMARADEIFAGPGR